MELQQRIVPERVDIQSYKHDKKFQFISGSDKWIEFKFRDDNNLEKTIHYFSDRHSLEGGCPESLKCKKSSSSPASPCFDFTYFLEKLFDEATKNKVYIDLFLEFPYNILKKDIRLSKYNLIDSYISLVYDKFQNCFTLQKKNCKYSPYVRMHYTDLRLAYSAVDKVVSPMQVSYELFVMCINKLTDMLEKNKIPDRRAFYDSFVFIDQLFQLHIQKSYDIFEILLTKDNYQNDLDEIYRRFFQSVEDLNVYPEIKTGLDEYIDALKSLHKTRNKKKIYIAKHQMDELRKDNVKYKGRNIADLISTNLLSIRKEIYNKFDKEIPKIWDKVAISFDELQQDYNIQNLVRFIMECQDYALVLDDTTKLIDALMLDAYILPRMFKYSRTNPSSLTIVFAGSGHIQFEVDFFKNGLGLNPTQQTSRVTGTKQCLFNPKFSEIFDIKRYAKTNYAHLKNIQLIELIKSRGLKRYSGKRKVELVQMLKDNDDGLVQPPRPKGRKSKKRKYNYTQWTNKELIEELKNRKIKGYSGKNKAQLISMIRDDNKRKRK